MPVEALSILGIPGSLRRLSYNRALLRAAGELAPDGMQIEITDLSPIPLYNADVEADMVPPSVRALRAQISAADAVLVATPEYNHLLPGVLKNAIDWASLPENENALRHKPVAIMGASTGISGTARAQLSLRQVLHATECYVLIPSHQVLIANARDRFDAQGRLTDERAREQIRSLLVALREWTERLRSR